MHTSDDGPIAGVEVRAVPVRAAKKRRGPESQSLQARLVQLATDERWQETHRRRARTDENGRYLLDGVLDCAYRLEASRDGYEKFGRNRNKMTLLVQRGEEKFEIRFDPSKQESGDELDPVCR